MITTDQLSLPSSPLELARLADSVAAALADANLSPLTDSEVVETVTTLERAHRRGDGVDAKLYVEVSDRKAFVEAGCNNQNQFYDGVLRLGAAAGKRRRLTAAAVGTFRNFQGETLLPSLPTTADAVAEGAIGVDHVLVVADTMKKIPASVPADLVADAEAQLAEVAASLTPRDLAIAGNALLERLDPDGALTDEHDRRRQRSVTLGAQDRRLMSKLGGTLTPQARAKFDALLIGWAAPGMNNPDDPESPHGPVNAEGLDPEAVAAAADRDFRSTEQRNHDALDALLTAQIRDGALGRPTSLPAHLVVTAELKDLEAHTGIALTSTGTRLPVADLVDLVADATPWLEVFADATSQILYLGRGKRLATLPQRLALFGRDRGCTAPACSVPFVRTQAHHMPDWQYGGPTDVDHLGAACGGHNRSVRNQRGGWETVVIAHGPHRGRVGWRRTGSGDPWQVNHSAHPEKLLRQEPGPTAPPRREPPRPSEVRAARSHGSSIERWLACRMPAPHDAVPSGVQIVVHTPNR
ncbi:13E12 repeat family protein [Gordonia sp. HY002]|uniref:DUF222 domain-containing protein n=1 Tax=Gordonia zhenghanii TaxID=2911516 RepID=UPI001F282979|nr:DUF222 domain-containing protein [Gordonia zhenghanii]MCF8571507.1 13E12 repeat family protein [Gordonia zhenghanii]